MENEIKVGEYVRTKDGRIGTFEEIDEHCRHYGERLEDKIYIIHTEKNEYLRLIENDIVKHSPNIIDLIQCGDYVNGEKVVDIFEIYDENEKLVSKRLLTEYRKAQYNGTYRQYYIYEQDTKTVVTKEQFESISYKVKE